MNLNFTPYRSPPYSISNSQRKPVQDKVKELVDLGVLEPITKINWGYPCFIINKTEGRGFRFLKDFHELNSILKRKPVYIERIEDIIDEIGYLNIQ